MIRLNRNTKILRTGPRPRLVCTNSKNEPEFTKKTIRDSVRITSDFFVLVDLWLDSEQVDYCEEWIDYDVHKHYYCKNPINRFLI